MDKNNQKRGKNLRQQKKTLGKYFVSNGAQKLRIKDKKRRKVSLPTQNAG